MIFMQGEDGKMMQIKKRLQKITILNQYYICMKWRQKKVCYGRENPDKTFYVIRRANSKVGLFSYVMTNLGHIRYAIEHGYIPVIDMKNNNNTYLEEDEVGQKNAWEFYFKQPAGYSLSDISKSKNVILSSGLIDSGIIFPDKQIAHDEKELSDWKHIADDFLNVTDEIKTEAEILFQKLFEKKRTLGVLARGTDYVKSKPRKHPIQPEVSKMIEKCKEVIQDYQCDKLYLTTEDQQIFEEFQQAFGDKLISLSSDRYQLKAGENINDVIQEKREKSKCLNGKDYLLSILLLSKCNCLVAGNAGGTQGALLLTEGYEYKYIFNLGVYE